MLRMTKTISPPKPSRVSVPVSAEVLDAFQRLAKAGNMSTGKAMAEWLSDTLDAAEFTAKKMEQARAAPRMVARELHAYALGLADETGDLIKTIAEKGRKQREPGSDSASGAPGREAAPPSCNTGGKLSGVNTQKHKRGAK